MSNVKTINLTGGETEVIFGQKFRCFWIQNLGDSDIYASPDPGVVPEADGVITIGAGASARVSAADLSKTDRLYLTGSGKVQIMGGYSAQCPFKAAPKGGESAGTTNYNDLSNKPMFDGKPLEGDMSFEDLGWYPLTKQDAMEIFNNAVKKLEPYDFLAEIPLNGSIDGYGYEILFKGSDTEKNVSENGLYLTASSCLNIKPTKEYSYSNEPYIIAFDCKMDNVSGMKEVFYLWTKSKRFHLINNNGIYALYTSSIENLNPTIVSGTNIPSDNEWRHIEIMLTHDNNYVKIKYCYDDTESPEIRMYNSADYPFNDICFGREAYPYNGYIKNIAIKIPKEDK